MLMVLDPEIRRRARLAEPRRGADRGGVYLEEWWCTEYFTFFAGVRAAVTWACVDLENKPLPLHFG
jgi:hypothetical protein